jgi:hypothetical protein
MGIDSVCSSGRVEMSNVPEALQIPSRILRAKLEIWNHRQG